MKILMEKTLNKWVNYQVGALIASDDELDRDEVLFTVLAQFVRSGDAERYVRRDGKIGWRVTSRFLETLREGEPDAGQYEEFI